MFLEILISFSWRKQKNDVIPGAGWLGQNDISQGQAGVCYPTKKLNKAEELAYLSINIAVTLLVVTFDISTN
jgi:hypothetical protein